MNLGCSTSNQLPADAPGRTAEDDASTQGTVTHVETQMKFPGSWFQPDPALSMTTICGVNQWVEALYLSLPLALILELP